MDRKVSFYLLLPTGTSNTLKKSYRLTGYCGNHWMNSASYASCEGGAFANTQNVFVGDGVVSFY